MGDYAEAEGAQRELVEANRAKWGEVNVELAKAVQNLAITVKDQGRYLEADSLAASAHRLFVESRGEDYYLTAFPLLTRAEILLVTEDYDTARAVAGEAFRILGATLPEGHYATAVAQCRLGRARVGLGERAEGRRLIQEASRALDGVDLAAAAGYKEECRTALRSIDGA
jgi:ATP/maltotriose-dependent transcriptional regulator MalT